MALARFLVVEDECSVARHLARIVGRFGEAAVEGTAGDARRLIAEIAPLSGVLIDVVLPDGSGLNLLEHLRVAHPATAALIFTGRMDPAVINIAYDLGARFLMKPFATTQIEQFALTAADRPSDLSFSSRAHRAAHAWVRRYAISEGEADVLERGVLGQSRSTMAKERSCSEQTINKHIANLLRRTEDDTFLAAVARVLRELAQQ